VSGFHFTTDFPENVISAQKLSTKFGSVFNFPAKFFGNNFNKFLSENRREAFGVSSENMLPTTFCGLLSVALNQHQAITNITKHSIQQRIFRRKIRK
ncbi:hypothetical protein, partial [Flavobacterium sp. LMO9]|uniref:hypothetical protein n=1 Tax=Flavobacterium sp. LMO9 TaxID=2654245 RepID=UPI001939B7DD